MAHDCPCKEDTNHDAKSKVSTAGPLYHATIRTFNMMEKDTFASDDMVTCKIII